MRTLIVGSGPTGLLLGAALARRGHRGHLRGPGPRSDGRRLDPSWRHAVRARPRLPAPGADDPPGGMAGGARPLAGPRRPTRSRCRAPPDLPRCWGCSRVGRPSSERFATRRGKQPGLTLRTGHVDGLVLDRGHVVGARVDGSLVEADLVVDASGRAGRLGRSSAQGGDPEPRRRLRPRVRRPHLPAASREQSPGPMVSPIAYMADFDGYQCLVFLHEAGHFSVVLVRPTADAALKALRFEAAFEAACRAIPALAEWTDRTARSPPSEVLVGGALRNVYRRQAGTPGLVAVGTRWRPRRRPEGAGSRWPACRSPRCSRCSTRARTPPRSPNRSAPGATSTSNPG